LEFDRRLGLALDWAWASVCDSSSHCPRYFSKVQRPLHGWATGGGKYARHWWLQGWRGCNPSIDDFLKGSSDVEAVKDGTSMAWRAKKWKVPTDWLGAC